MTFVAYADIKHRLPHEQTQVFQSDDGTGRGVRVLRDFAVDEIICSYGGRLLMEVGTGRGGGGRR